MLRFYLAPDGTRLAQKLLTANNTSVARPQEMNSGNKTVVTQIPVTHRKKKAQSSNHSIVTTQVQAAECKEQVGSEDQILSSPSEKHSYNVKHWLNDLNNSLGDSYFVNDDAVTKSTSMNSYSAEDAIKSYSNDDDWEMQPGLSEKINHCGNHSNRYVFTTLCTKVI